LTTDLAIKDVAERTGIAAGTIRMWEQRYGFPVPGRNASGYRRYTEDDVEALRKVLALRHRGLSVPAAISRAQDNAGVADHPSIYAAVAAQDVGARPQALRKSTLVALSKAIEHEALALAAAPLVFGAFQHERFYRAVEKRWRRLSLHADASAVFADFPDGVRHRSGAPTEIRIGMDDVLGNEWAVVIDAPGYAACLLAWEQPELDDPDGARDGDRLFEAIWTIDAEATRRAAQVAAKLAGRADPAYGERLEELLADRPLALEEPAPGLTALTNRMVAYLEAAGRR
jgi:DICT domain-containing protein